MNHVSVEMSFGHFYRAASVAAHTKSQRIEQRTQIIARSYLKAILKLVPCVRPVLPLRVRSKSTFDDAYPAPGADLPWGPTTRHASMSALSSPRSASLTSPRGRRDPAELAPRHEFQDPSPHGGVARPTIPDAAPQPQDLLDPGTGCADMSAPQAAWPADARVSSSLPRRNGALRQHMTIADWATAMQVRRRVCFARIQLNLLCFAHPSRSWSGACVRIYARARVRASGRMHSRARNVVGACSGHVSQECVCVCVCVCVCLCVCV
jgi:hypothetical protein